MRTIKSFTEAAKGPRRALALFVALALLSGMPAVAEMAPASADSFAQEAQQYLVDHGLVAEADLTVGYLASAAGEINPIHCNERDMVSLNQLVFE